MSPLTNIVKMIAKISYLSYLISSHLLFISPFEDLDVLSVSRVFLKFTL